MFTSSALYPPISRDKVCSHLSSEILQDPVLHSNISPWAGRNPRSHSIIHLLPSAKSRVLQRMRPFSGSSGFTQPLFTFLTWIQLIIFRPHQHILFGTSVCINPMYYTVLWIWGFCVRSMICSSSVPLCSKLVTSSVRSTGNLFESSVNPRK